MISCMFSSAGIRHDGGVSALLPKRYLSSWLQSVLDDEDAEIIWMHMM